MEPSNYEIQDRPGTSTTQNIIQSGLNSTIVPSTSAQQRKNDTYLLPIENLKISGHCMSYCTLYDEAIITGGTLDGQTGYPVSMSVIRIKKSDMLSSKSGYYTNDTTMSHVLPKRLSHAQAIFGKKLIVFGGWSGVKVLQDMYIATLEKDSLIWEEVNLRDGTTTSLQNTNNSIQNVVNTTVFPVQSSNEDLIIPSSRSNMAYSSLEDRKELVIFGGLGRSVSDVYGDLWIFSLSNLKWRQIEFTPQLTACRSAAMMTDSKNRRIFLFGGCTRENIECTNNLYELNFNVEYTLATVTRRIAINSQMPPERLYCAGIYSPMRNSIIIIGGRDVNRGEKYDDCWEYNLNNDYCFQKNEVSWRSLPPLSGHACCTIGSCIVVHGGSGLTKRYSDFRIWNMYPCTSLYVDLKNSFADVYIQSS